MNKIAHHVLLAVWCLVAAAPLSVVAYGGWLRSQPVPDRVVIAVVVGVWGIAVIVAMGLYQRRVEDQLVQRWPRLRAETGDEVTA